MDFEYRGKSWLKSGFRFPGLLQYIEATREKLRQPLKIPPYATAGEQERIKTISEKIKKDPYQGRIAINESIKVRNESFSEVQMIPYGEYPLLYDICTFAAKRLMDLSVLVFLYSTEEAEYIYHAFAVDYQDKVWIYISKQLFREHGMLTEEEIAYLVGRELGHAQCHHSTISALSRKNNDQLYSADRAGLIICAAWIMMRHPECEPEQAAKKAVECGASTLQKLTIGSENGPGKNKWNEFDYDLIRNMIAGAFHDAAKLSAKTKSKPDSRHRIMAMVHFSQSQLFYRCLGLDPGSFKNLYSDEQLKMIMAYQLVNN